MVKIQKQSGRYFVTIPKEIIDQKNWEKGTDLSFELDLTSPGSDVLVDEKNSYG